MGTEIDWQRELDASFGIGTDAPPVGHYVTAGRTAVRRRRMGTVAIVAAMVVGAGAAWASGPGGTPRGEAPVATQGPAPTADGQPTMSEREARKERLARLREVTRDQGRRQPLPATLTPDGLVLSTGAGPVLQRVPNPMGYQADQGRSVGIRVMMYETEYYSLLTLYSDDSTSMTTVQATGDFDGWLSGAVRTQQTLDAANGTTPSGGDASGQPWLVLDASGTVSTARPGVVIVEQRASVDLGESFSGDASEAGVVRLLVDGRSEFAAYRIIDGTLDVVPAGGTFPSMDAFIEWARQQYASGAGMR